MCRDFKLILSYVALKCGGICTIVNTKCFGEVVVQGQVLGTTESEFPPGVFL